MIRNKQLSKRLSIHQYKQLFVCVDVFTPTVSVSVDNKRSNAMLSSSLLCKKNELSRLFPTARNVDDTGELKSSTNEILYGWIIDTKIGERLILNLWSEKLDLIAKGIDNAPSMTVWDAFNQQHHGNRSLQRNVHGVSNGTIRRAMVSSVLNAIKVSPALTWLSCHAGEVSHKNVFF